MIARAFAALLLLIAALGSAAQPVSAQTDVLARGIAVRAQSIAAAVPKQGLRKKVTLLVLGQSTEQGPVLLNDKAAWPNAFASLRNPGFMQKRVVSNPNRGGWWPKVYDDLWDWGYDLDVLNAAVGGASLLDHIVGTYNSRVSNYVYYQARPSVGYPDLGDFGQVIAFNGMSFVISGGRKRQAYNDLPFQGAVGTSVLQDFIGYSQTSELSGSTAPDVSAVPVGGTVADGSLTLTRLDGAYYVSEATFLPGHDGTQPNINWTGTFGERLAGRGFDPLGIITHANRLAQQAAPSELKIVYFSQGQSDLGASATGYQKPLMILANYFLRRGWTVVLGNTVFSPASSGSTQANYDSQATAVDNAIAALSVFYPGKVYRGANLHNALGRTGRMGGMRVTGSITGNNLLTITATLSGSEVAPGQKVYDGQTVVGTVATLGTYNGTSGAGTVNLIAGATNVGSRTLISVGSGLQFDGVHMNGSVVADGGAAIANSLKAFLPRLPVP